MVDPAANDSAPTRKAVLRAMLKRDCLRRQHAPFGLGCAPCSSRPVASLAVVLVLILIGLPAGVGAEDSPSFLGPNRDGKSNETGLFRAWGEDGPKQLWRLDKDLAGSGYAGVAVAEGRVFFFDRHDGKARLRALEPGTGREIWRSEYPYEYEDHFGYSDGPRATPTFIPARSDSEDDLVVTFGVEGNLSAYRASDGELIWRIDTGNEYGVVQNFFGVGSTPWLEPASDDHPERLIVMVGGSPKDTPDLFSGKTEPDGSALVAFDPRTGKELWRRGNHLASYSSPLVADIAGARRGIAFLRGGLSVFDPADGNEQLFLPHRAKKLYSVNAATPVVDGDRILITESYEKGALQMRLQSKGDGLSHEVIWQDPPRRGQSLASHWSTPVLHDGVLYGCHGEKEGNAELRAIDWDTGKVLWSEKGLGRSTIVWVDDHLLVLGERGLLALVEATGAGYRVKARVDLDLTFPAWNPPVLSDGVLYVRGARELMALEVLPAAR